MKEREEEEKGRTKHSCFFCCYISFVGLAPTLLYTTTFLPNYQPCMTACLGIKIYTRLSNISSKQLISVRELSLFLEWLNSLVKIKQQQKNSTEEIKL